MLPADCTVMCILPVGEQAGWLERSLLLHGVLDPDVDGVDAEAPFVCLSMCVCMCIPMLIAI